MKAADFLNFINKWARELQEYMENIEVEGEAGGGMVKVKANARKQIVKIEIEPSLLREQDKEMLEELIKAACNDALSKCDSALINKFFAMGFKNTEESSG